MPRVAKKSAPSTIGSALDGVTIGKAIVSRDGDNIKRVRLLTPAETIDLPTTDPLYTLPTGTKLTKRPDGKVAVHRLDIGGADPVLVTDTVDEAIAQYLVSRT